eukprot:TRINITY_DN14040_c0_g1_i8.p1 TRINITY_DN14040_c0_g1~~TRINITY_DN14040_c0_g1_i8.p1  ORF type:complete len:1355 (-),score=269.43 TRINITY_DN14040_c0_g1_i8:144-4208(-)
MSVFALNRDTNPFLQKLMATPEVQRYMEESVNIVLQDLGLGTLNPVGGIMYAYFGRINDIDSDGYILLQSAKVKDESYGRDFAEQLRTLVLHVVTKQYIIFELKVGDDPLFADASAIGDIICSGHFEKIYTASPGGGHRIEEIEEQFLQEIRQAEGSPEAAARIAKELKCLRWNVTEISSREKCLPFVLKAGDQIPRRIPLWEALMKAPVAPKLDAAAVLKRGEMTEVEFMYKAVLGDEAMKIQKASFSLGQGLLFACEMCERAKEKLSHCEVLKAGKRIWKVLFIVETERISEHPLLWTDILLKLFNSLAAFAGEISAKLDCLVRALQLHEATTDEEKKLQRLDDKMPQMKQSMAAYLRRALDELKEQALQDNRDGDQDAKCLMDDIDTIAKPFRSAAEFNNKAWIQKSKKASDDLKKLASKQAETFLEQHGKLNLGSCIDRLSEILRSLDSKLTDDQKDAKSGSFACHSILPPLNLEASDTRVPTDGVLGHTQPNASSSISERTMKLTDVNVVNFIRKQVSIALRECSTTRSGGSQSSEDISLDGDTMPSVLVVVPSCDQATFLEQRKAKKMLAKHPGLWECLRLFPTDDIDELTEELGDNDFPQVIQIEGMPTWRRPFSDDAVLPEEVSDVLLDAVKIALPPSLQKACRAVVISAGKTSWDSAQRWFTEDGLMQLQSDLLLIACRESTDRRAGQDFTKRFYEALLKHNALDKSSISTAFAQATARAQHQYIIWPQAQGTDNGSADVQSCSASRAIAVECSAKDFAGSEDGVQFLEAVLKACPPLRRQSDVDHLSEPTAQLHLSLEPSITIPAETANKVLERQLMAVETNAFNKSEAGAQGDFVICAKGSLVICLQARAAAKLLQRMSLGEQLWLQDLPEEWGSREARISQASLLKVEFEATVQADAFESHWSCMLQGAWLHDAADGLMGARGYVRTLRAKVTASRGNSENVEEEEVSLSSCPALNTELPTSLEGHNILDANSKASSSYRVDPELARATSTTAVARARGGMKDLSTSEAMETFATSPVTTQSADAECQSRWRNVPSGEDAQPVGDVTDTEFAEMLAAACTRLPMLQNTWRIGPGGDVGGCKRAPIVCSVEEATYSEDQVAELLTSSEGVHQKRFPVVRLMSGQELPVSSAVDVHHLQDQVAKSLGVDTNRVRLDPPDWDSMHLHGEVTAVVVSEGAALEALLLEKTKTTTEEDSQHQTKHFPNGDRYVGPLKDDKMHGYEGTYYYANGEKYVGPMKEGKRHGDKGTVYRPDGSIWYVGPFKENQKHGAEGTYYWADGRKYVGPMKDGKHHGDEGTWYRPDGSIRYVGPFKDNRRHGEGLEYDVEGKVRRGRWEDGRHIEWLG